MYGDIKTERYGTEIISQQSLKKRKGKNKSRAQPFDYKGSLLPLVL